MPSHSTARLPPIPSHMLDEDPCSQHEKRPIFTFPDKCRSTWRPWSLPCCFWCCQLVSLTSSLPGALPWLARLETVRQARIKNIRKHSSDALSSTVSGYEATLHWKDLWRNWPLVLGEQVLLLLKTTSWTQSNQIANRSCFLCIKLKPRDETRHQNSAKMKTSLFLTNIQVWERACCGGNPRHLNRLNLLHLLLLALQEEEGCGGEEEAGWGGGEEEKRGGRRFWKTPQWRKKSLFEYEYVLEERNVLFGKF